MTTPSMRHRPLQLSAPLDTHTLGFWQLLARSIDGSLVDLTTFRGVPMQLGSFTTSDPFGDKSFTFSTPAITPLDGPGVGDLGWLHKGARIQLRFLGALPASYPYGAANYATGPHGSNFTHWTPGFTWNGLLLSYDPSTDSGATMTVTGTAYQLDYYQAKPEYPMRPYPYEHAIARCFEAKPHLKMSGLRIAWPSWWTKTYTPPKKGTASYLVPQLVHSGDYWTGLLTRETGKWEAMLTSYIQTILAGMYTGHGRWTIDVDMNRSPLLIHRDILLHPGPSTFVIDPLAPGNKLTLSVDWSQTLDVVYGQGTALDGVTYSGMEVSSDGSQTTYLPMASRRQAYPTENNAWLNRSEMPIEVMLAMQAGLNEADAELVSADHLRRFADPGVTGSITVAVDPTLNGVPISYAFIRAGSVVQVPGLFGRSEGITMHVTDTSVDPVAHTNTLTVDSKWRDALTVAEVRMRGRDAMKIPRMLVGGQYSPPVPDQLVPWNYAKGSGYIPSGKALDCVELFEGMPDSEQFPWVNWTKTRPPSAKKWRDSYIHIPKPKAGQGAVNADYNWAYVGGGPISGRKGIPMEAAQVATIRLLQVAAYNANGTVAKVPFHISFFWSNGVNVDSMPQLLSSDLATAPAQYNTGQHYPFGKSAWEKYNPDGTLVNPTIPQATDSAGLIRAYGTFFQMAGYFPGADTGPGVGVTVHSRAGAATGLLVDETTWSIDTTQTLQQFDPVSKKRNKTNPFAGRLYVMIYCDEQASDVYFLGRMFRVEPGTGS